jgi:hypothetical protein
MMPHGIGGAKTGFGRDAFDRDLRGFQQLARLGDARLHHPFTGRHPGCILKTADEGAPAHPRLGGKARDRQFAIEMALRPGKYGGESIAFDRGNRLPDVLRLTTFAMRRDDQAPRHMVGDLRAVVAPHDVQAKVEPRRAAGRGQDIAVVDIEHIRIDLRPRIAA